MTYDIANTIAATKERKETQIQTGISEPPPTTLNLSFEDDRYSIEIMGWQHPTEIAYNLTTIAAVMRPGRVTITTDSHIGKSPKDDPAPIVPGVRLADLFEAGDDRVTEAMVILTATADAAPVFLALPYQVEGTAVRWLDDLAEAPTEVAGDVPDAIEHLLMARLDNNELAMFDDVLETGAIEANLSEGDLIAYGHAVLLRCWVELMMSRGSSAMIVGATNSKSNPHPFPEFFLAEIDNR